jgi:hypothetical protein
MGEGACRNGRRGVQEWEKGRAGMGEGACRNGRRGLQEWEKGQPCTARSPSSTRISAPAPSSASDPCCSSATLVASLLQGIAPAPSSASGPAPAAPAPPRRRRLSAAAGARPTGRHTSEGGGVPGDVAGPHAGGRVPGDVAGPHDTARPVDKWATRPHGSGWPPRPNPWLRSDP